MEGATGESSGVDNVAIAVVVIIAIACTVAVLLILRKTDDNETAVNSGTKGNAYARAIYNPVYNGSRS